STLLLLFLLLLYVLSYTSRLPLSFYWPRHHRHLLSFPTRRSSDLVHQPDSVASLANPGLVRSASARVLISLLIDSTPLVSPGLRSEEHTSELQSRENLVCRLLLEKKKNSTKRVSTSHNLCMVENRK